MLGYGDKGGMWSRGWQGWIVVQIKEDWGGVMCRGVAT